MINLVTMFKARKDTTNEVTINTPNTLIREAFSANEARKYANLYLNQLQTDLGIFDEYSYLKEFICDLESTHKEYFVELLRSLPKEVTMALIDVL